MAGCKGTGFLIRTEPCKVFLQSKVLSGDDTVFPCTRCRLAVVLIIHTHIAQWSRVAVYHEAAVLGLCQEGSDRTS